MGGVKGVFWVRYYTRKAQVLQCSTPLESTLERLLGLERSGDIMSPRSGPDVGSHFASLEA